MDELGARVRTARESKGMTQSDLARATRLSPGAVSRIEHGERVPGSTTLARLAQALGLEVGALLNGGQPQPKPRPPQPTEAVMLPSMPDHDGEVLEAIQLIARDMPSLPQAGRKRVLLVLKAVLSPSVTLHILS